VTYVSTLRLDGRSPASQSVSSISSQSTDLGKGVSRRTFARSVEREGERERTRARARDKKKRERGIKTHKYEVSR